VDACFDDILYNLGIFFREPAVEGWDTHGCFELVLAVDYWGQDGQPSSIVKRNLRD
jgi:hypothetical protein